MNHRFIVQFKNAKSVQNFMDDASFLKTKKQAIASGNIVSFVSNFDEVEKKLLINKYVSAIDILENKPKEELAIKGFDLSSNQLNMVHAKYPLFLGDGQHISIKENAFDTADIDLKGRIDPSPLASKEITNHANFMATIIAGGGNSIYYALGAAPAAWVSSSSFENVLPDPDEYYLQNNITIQNHSYGTTIDNNYGLNAVAFDESAHKNESLLHVFSSGNSGLDTGKTGTYSNVPGFANITGNFKMAKNILVVGAVDSFGNVAVQSSAGPAYDGRIIPQLVAFQMNGTSESAALVSGTVALLQQFYIEKNQEDLPSALAKAILINSADDVNNPGPDFKTGFGNMNAMKAMNCINENKILSGSIGNGITNSFDLTIPENTSLLKITLVWNDTTASTLSPKALMNDLDLELLSTSKNKTWNPWVLNTFPNEDSLNKPAVRMRDSLNNQEQITLENPVAGNYKIKVIGHNILTSDQKYFIAYSLDSAFYFIWQRPAGDDFAEKGTATILKWQSSFTGIGVLEYKFISDQSWRKIADVDFSKSNFRWLVPDTIAHVLLRMKINSSYFYSDTFLITTLLQPKTGFICGDSILIYWNKP
ncbi:MAG: S8 family serine peptidase, partial [Ginsengibacter sp.]